LPPFSLRFKLRCFVTSKSRPSCATFVSAYHQINARHYCGLEAVQCFLYFGMNIAVRRHSKYFESKDRKKPRFLTIAITSGSENKKGAELGPFRCCRLPG
jgi:hypothetical protein